MNPVKTLLLVTAAVSMSVLAACGVDATDDSMVDMQVAQTQLKTGAEGHAMEVAAAVPGLACTGVISCTRSNASASVPCSASGNVCSAVCPYGYTQNGGACTWTKVPAPAPVPEPVPAPDPVAELP
jgi:hypothetical protein